MGVPVLVLQLSLCKWACLCWPYNSSLSRPAYASLLQLFSLNGLVCQWVCLCCHATTLLPEGACLCCSVSAGATNLLSVSGSELQCNLSYGCASCDNWKFGSSLFLSTMISNCCGFVSHLIMFSQLTQRCASSIHQPLILMPPGDCLLQFS